MSQSGKLLNRYAEAAMVSKMKLRTEWRALSHGERMKMRARLQRGLALNLSPYNLKKAVGL